MREWQSLSHVKWECKYHVVIVPKYRKRVLYGRVKREVGKIIRQLCRQKKVELLEGHAMPDHIHLVLSVPPKLSIAIVLGYLKGKSAIRGSKPKSTKSLKPAQSSHKRSILRIVLKINAHPTLARRLFSQKTLSNESLRIAEFQEALKRCKAASLLIVFVANVLKFRFLWWSLKDFVDLGLEPPSWKTANWCCQK